MGYRKIEYLQSSGSQYIDTGVFANPHYSIEISFMLTEQTSNWDTIFGARNGSNSRFTARFYNSIDGTLGIQYSRSGTGSATQYELAHTKSKFTEQFHIIKAEKNLWYIDNVLEKTFSTPSNKTAYPYSLYLFANNNAGTVGDFGYFRIAYCKMWNDGELVRDFIPVLDENDVPCMYDIVTESYFYNSGTGSFLAGDVILENSIKYLIRSNHSLYTIVDETLTALQETVVESSLFNDKGFNKLPDSSFLLGLWNPEVLYWQSSTEEELPTMTATMTATPFPQTVVSPNYDMSHDTILGIECAYVTASSDVVFAISVDDGVTWYMWTGQAWGILTDTATGMTAETINAITTEQWAGLTTTGQFKVRMTLFDENSSFTSFVMDYIN